MSAATEGIRALEEKVEKLERIVEMHSKQLHYFRQLELHNADNLFSPTYDDETVRPFPGEGGRRR